MNHRSCSLASKVQDPIGARRRRRFCRAALWAARASATRVGCKEARALSATRWGRMRRAAVCTWRPPYSIAKGFKVGGRHLHAATPDKGKNISDRAHSVGSAFHRLEDLACVRRRLYLIRLLARACFKICHFLHMQYLIGCFIALFLSLFNKK